MVTPTWLRGSDYHRRVKLTIDPSKVDAALTDFPVLIQLNGSSGTGSRNMHQLFDDVADEGGRFKIAITTSDGVTEIHAEIEEWDHANKQAWLHVKVPSVSNSVDTVLYLYWGFRALDNHMFIHDHDGAGAETVWDSDYVAVMHMRDKPAMVEIAEELSEVDLGINQYQGVATDGTFWYVIYSHTGDIRDGDPPLVRNNTIDKYEIATGNLVLHKDNIYDVNRTFSSGEVINGQLYVTVRNFGTGDAWAHVIIYDLDTLTEQEDIELGSVADEPFEGDDVANVGWWIIEGISFHHGDFWVVFGGAGTSHDCAIGRYDGNDLSPTGELASFRMFPNGSGQFGGQDIWWRGDDEIILQNHEPHDRPWFEIWKWTGSTFEERAVYESLVEDTVFMSQGFTLLNGRIYMIGRYENALFKVDTTAKTEDGPRTFGVADATSNRNNAEKAADTNPNEVTVLDMPGRAQDFVTFDDIDMGIDGSLRPPSTISVEVLVNATAFNTADEGKNTILNLQQGVLFQLRGDTDNEGKVAIHLRNVTTTGTYRFSHAADGVGVAALNAGQTYHLAWYWDQDEGANGTLRLYIDGVEHTAGDYPATTSLIDAAVTYPNPVTDFHTIGDQDVASTRDRFFNGRIGEVRISDVARDPAWLIAGYHSIVDDFMEYGGVEQVPIAFPVMAY